MKYRDKLQIMTGCLLLCTVLTGCGPAGKNSGVEEGMAAIANMDYQGALASFDAAELNGENKRLIARGRGIACIGLTDYETAAAYLEESLSYSYGLITDMDYDINYYLAAAYGKSGDYEKAQQIYTAILALLPEEADAYYLRGNALLELGQYEKAEADFDKVMQLSPNDYDKLIQIYEVLEAHDRKEKGLSYLQDALNNRADKMGAYDKGRIYYHMGEYQQACLNLEEAKSKGTAETYLYLGRAYEATGDYNYAINNVYTTYLSSNPANAEIYNQLGLCYLNQQNYQAALEAFQKAMNIEDNGMLQTLQFNEIVAYEYLGQYTNAAVLLDNYLKTYPDDTQAQREYGFLSTR